MAPVLQCPDCKTKHPLDAVGDVTSFPCSGCGRTLKVPEVARAHVAATPAAAPAPVAPEATRAVPVAAAPPPPAAEPAAPAPEPVRTPPPPTRRRADVPWWMRLLLWIVAVPVSFVIVFSIARMSGVFTHDQLTDVFLASGRSRFWPLARVLPFVAVLTALIVQGGVVLLGRRRTRRAGAQAQGSTTAGSRDAKQPSTRTSRS
jgi:hypothetical protein